MLLSVPIDPPDRRNRSPSGGSTLITSAPMSARCCVANGPSSTAVKSITFTPVSGPGIFPSLSRLVLHALWHMLPPSQENCVDERSVGRPAGGECRTGGRRTLLLGAPRGRGRARAQDRAAGRRFRARLRQLRAWLVELFRLAQSRQAIGRLGLQEEGRLRPAAAADRQGRRADPEPGAGCRPACGLRFG